MLTPFLKHFLPKASQIPYSSIFVVYWGVTFFYLLKYKRRSLFCFELFFSVSFFLCLFMTRYLLPLMDAYESMSFIEDSSLIFRAYTLSMIGYLSYILGLVLTKKKKVVDNKVLSYGFEPMSRQVNVLANLLCTSFIILMFVNGGTSMFSMYSNPDVLTSDRLSGFAMYLNFAIITYIVSVVTTFASLPNRKGTFHLSIIHSFALLFIVNSIILIGTFLLSGYRSNAIQIIIPIVLAYQIKYKPLKPLTVIGVFAVGALLMFFIGMTRSGDAFDTTGYSTLTYLRDFKSANSATIFLVNYADMHGVTYGTNMIFPILSIIPGLQSVVGLFVDSQMIAPVSSATFTMAFSSNSGFGTNIIGDIYYTFGFLGVIVLMFIYGCFLRRFSNAKNNYEIVMFLVFSGNAMFAPSVEYCYIIRSIAWSVIFLFLVRLFQRSYNL